MIERRGGMHRHDLDPVALVSGGVFAGLGLSFLLGGNAFLDVDWRWIWPPLLIGGGVLGLLRGGRRQDLDARPDAEG
jgi:hypothetical protein